MAHRIGIDMVSVDSVRESLAHHGQRYLDAVYTPGEVADCRRAGAIDPRRLAGRFAAKEATCKVLEIGPDALGFDEIEVVCDPSGALGLCLGPTASRLAARARIHHLALSIAHQPETAAAVVVAESRFQESAQTPIEGT